MSEVRMGVIGCGGMAQGHMRSFKDIKGLKFVAAADAVEQSVNAIAKEYDVKPFTDGEALINSGDVDAVLVATPHYFHPPLVIAALNSGLHVLTEKPVAVTAKSAAKMNEAARANPKLVFAVMFQLRLRSQWKLVKRLIEEDRFGDILRVSWNITTWFRNQGYYDSGTWRATWAGEGGGVLINQCPHNLDILQWLVGMPSKVTAKIGLGKHHDIEVEDEVNAILEFPNGATGTFVTSTAEAPGVDRLEIVGDKATVIVERGKKIELIENNTPAKTILSDKTKSMGPPPSTRYEIETGEKDGDYYDVTQNFVNAILHGEKLIAPGVEGINSLELGNAMVMSGLTGQTVELPTDRDEYAKLIEQLIEKAKK